MLYTGEGFPNAESLLDAIQEFDEELDDESEEEETEENAAQPTLDQGIIDSFLT